MNEDDELTALVNNLSKRTIIHDAEGIVKYFKRIVVNKRERILESNSRCNFIYYIYNGALRSYIETNNKEVTIMLAFKDWWITDIDSFTNGTISNINIDVQQDSIIYALSKNNFDKLIAISPTFESAFRKMMQYSYIREQRRSVALIHKTSKTRYLELIDKFPTIEQDISQKVIASYLGISPEFLSAMKKKIKLKS